jgi:hypothetical protein
MGRHLLLNGEFRYELREGQGHSVSLDIGKPK